jgi:RNA polymerase sigma-70 factor (ECF subfamily)
MPRDTLAPPERLLGSPQRLEPGALAALAAPAAPGDVGGKLARERPRLVALCASLTGDLSAAEELAQETLLEAWRHHATLRDPTRLQAWLSGIARNVCLRWERAQGRERRRAALDPTASAPENDQGDRFVDDVNTEIELERRELIELLDRALASLPPGPREALIARYAWDLPLAEIAGRAGISVAAATMRVQRAKRALHRILTTTLRAEIAPYLVFASAGWQETRIWCPVCGQRRLRGRVSDDGALLLTCPACFPAPNGALFNTCQDIWGQVKGYGRALSRTLDWMDTYYRRALTERTVTCYVCGTALSLRGSAPLALTGWGADHALGFLHRCHSCGAASSQPLAGLALASPAGRRFQQAHPRMRLLPAQDIEADGHPAVVVRFVSLTTRDALDVVFARVSGRVLRIQPES